eukprot:CAMPEP_0198138712 /NCGR_PEP_ID=MMETSP1443-20131203/2114_1 /TAXON_ID=186043 /ORGANISM="Entomoneis sp., Strain CCMP2396" /LENGTH=71 /DNA_ID=CAMNT_0043800609 /DNA_START=13 /DNA_END=228 /DNA_ORIENTATION=+
MTTPTTNLHVSMEESSHQTDGIPRSVTPIVSEAFDSRVWQKGSVMPLMTSKTVLDRKLSKASRDMKVQIMI